MEDRKLFYTFTTVGVLLNSVLIFLLVNGLSIYLENIKNFESNKNTIKALDQEIDQFNINTSKPLQDSNILKNRFKSTTSVSEYIEKLVLKTNEKNIQIYQSTILSSLDKEINMELILYGTLDGISRTINEIEKELPLTEISNSEIEISGQYVKVKLNLRILVDQKW